MVAVEPRPLQPVINQSRSGPVSAPPPHGDHPTVVTAEALAATHASGQGRDLSSLVGCHAAVAGGPKLFDLGFKQRQLRQQRLSCVVPYIEAFGGPDVIQPGLCILQCERETARFVVSGNGERRSCFEDGEMFVARADREALLLCEATDPGFPCSLGRHAEYSLPDEWAKGPGLARDLPV